MNRSITIELTEEETEEFVKFMYYEILCKTLTPDISPKDKIALRAIGALKTQAARNSQIANA